MGRRPENGGSQKTCHDHKVFGNKQESIMIIYVRIPLFLFLLSFVVLPLQPQELPVRHIREVTVTQGNQEFFSDDHTTQTVEPMLETTNKHRSIGYLLERETPALIRNYGGSGSLTSVSLHGTGTNHTQVSWNGFPLNSPTTGQVDLSLIPTGFMQTVAVTNGASGSLFGSGTFGGSIALNNEPDWSNKFALSYSLDAGSFGSLGNMLTLSTGNRRVQYRLSAATERSENNFTYRDYYRSQAPEIKVKHNAYRSLGLIQNLSFNLGRGNHLDGGIWYQYKSLEIPALMGSYKEAHAKQKDSLFRSFVSYRKITDKSALMIRSAYFSDFLRYTDKNNASDPLYALDSRIATGRFMNEADFRYYFSQFLIIGGGAAYNHITGSSGNYGGKISENEYVVFSNMKVVLADFIINAGLRKEFYNGLNPPLQYSLGVRYKLAEKVVLRSGFSSKFRKPTFNEKYWRPGGNPMLQPETGRGGELTAEWFTGNSQSSGFWLDARVTGYYQWIDNWIQWVMHDSLTPVEYKEVHARGIDTWMEFGYSRSRLHIKGMANYSYNRSVIAGTYDDNRLFEGNQLMYAPIHALRAGLDISLYDFTLGVSTSYTGYRETVETADKTLGLPAYGVLNLMTGFHRKILKADIALDFFIDNVFDKSYEIIRSYPVPGRSFHFTLSVGLQTNNTQY
jgi:vitamin B12 transporter